MKNMIVFIRKNISYIYTFILWVLMIWIFWFLKYSVYGGNLETGFISFLIFPPLFVLLVFFCRKYENEYTDLPLLSNQKIWNNISKIFELAFYVILIWLIFFVNPYIVTAYQFLLILIVLNIIYYFPKLKGYNETCIEKNKMTFFIIIIVTLITTTLSFCIIANPITLNEASSLLEEEGYENVEYVDNINSSFVLKKVFSDNEIDLLKNEDTMNFYLYRVEKNGEDYGIAISLIGRRIVAKSIVSNNETLKYFFKK